MRARSHIERGASPGRRGRHSRRCRNCLSWAHSSCAESSISAPSRYRITSTFARSADPTTAGVPAWEPRSISATSNPWSRTPRSGLLVWRTSTATVPPNRALSAGLLSKLSTCGKPSRRRRSLKRRESRGLPAAGHPWPPRTPVTRPPVRRPCPTFSNRPGTRSPIQPSPGGTRLVRRQRSAKASLSTTAQRDHGSGEPFG